MPGYCVQGTIGHKILNGQRKLEMEGRATVRNPKPTLHFNQRREESKYQSSRLGNEGMLLQRKVSHGLKFLQQN